MLKAFKHHPDAVIPTQSYPGKDAGHDLYSIKDVFLPLGEVTVVETGIALEIPENAYVRISDRSSMGRRGLAVMGGVVDTGFTGPLQVMLANVACKINEHEGRPGYWVRKGDKVAQAVYEPFIKVALYESKELWTSERGSKGLGSSGR